MKIYKHSFNDFRNEIETVEIEVEEKPKTYVVVKSQKGVWESRINKNDIGVLSRNWTKAMFSLTPDRKPYINALIADTENNIKNMENSLDKALKRKYIYLELLRKEDEVK